MKTIILESICHNNNLHRAHLGYLELALYHIQKGNREGAALLLRAFTRAEALRREERKMFTNKPSPHEARQVGLYLALKEAMKGVMVPAA